MVADKRGCTLNEIEKIIKQAEHEGLEELDLRNRGVSRLPEEIGNLQKLKRLKLNGNQLKTVPKPLSKLVNLLSLDISHNQLTSLPEWLGQFVNLRLLNIGDNQVTSLPDWLAQLKKLEGLGLHSNQLTFLPDSIDQLENLYALSVFNNQLTCLPESLVKLSNLEMLFVGGNLLTFLPERLGQIVTLQEFSAWGNKLTSLPESMKQLVNLKFLQISLNNLPSLPEWLGQLINLRHLDIAGSKLTFLPEWLGQLVNLKHLDIAYNQLTSLPEWLGQFVNLQHLNISHNKLTSLPPNLANLKNLEVIDLNNNPIYPALKTVNEGGIESLFAYLRSLMDPSQIELLYEAKLILVGQGKAGKTSLLKVLSGRPPRRQEPTTHGMNIWFQAFHTPQPGQEGGTIKYNAWDFGGQEVERVTHQFFFSPEAVYLLVWDPRPGLEQHLVEDLLKLIRQRVGEAARVIIVSTHCRDRRLGRLDQEVLRRDFGNMIIGFHEVDSLKHDRNSGDKVGILRLKEIIAKAAKDLTDMGTPFNRQWRQARDEIMGMAESHPHIPYGKFVEVCWKHGLEGDAAATLAQIMHRLGYIVYFAEVECLKDDVILQPQWLTKAISFVLEDRTIQEMDGILPDNRLSEVWYSHGVAHEPKFEPALYPFFLRLMEKYDFSYRLETGDASLIAQNVPQVRPSLPWLPERKLPPTLRRLSLVCTMEEVPLGLVPLMTVRTHRYAYTRTDVGGRIHRLHWQRGIFLRHQAHGEALLELREREFHLYVQAVWPTYFMNTLRDTLNKLISDNWPGMKDSFSFAVPCPGQRLGHPCEGRFRVEALHHFLEDGLRQIPCQFCLQPQDTIRLLHGFERETASQQLDRIEEMVACLPPEISRIKAGIEVVSVELEEVKSQQADLFMKMLHAMADEAKEGPRFFTLEPSEGNWRRPLSQKYRLHLWCEAEDCQHPVVEEGKGRYEFPDSRQWVKTVAPYANRIARVLKAIVPLASPALNEFFGPNTTTTLGLKDRLDLMKEGTDKTIREMRISDHSMSKEGNLSEAERSGVLALHSLLRELDPHHALLGLTRVATYTGEYRWLCRRHYEETLSKIPDRIE
jgi:internalin A